ncbi:MAG: helix-hairpin-helix domain-containing protein [Desulfobulbaceae bacterium]|uniref:Helix-hairpin-helix domain-containing protein n=1 Tax=Candidatus Desulfobia pelagia TaxID=2841692 RepID=A0A8J6ND94_9BACT|nr:helix-hairpin-helix domain-containing protein [Candidatus Desulfobia pelagia]
MNRNRLHPDNTLARDRKDYKILVLLVLGLSILFWSRLTVLPSSYHEDGYKSLFEHPVPLELRQLFFHPVPINSASRQLLESIPGIGPHLSGQIVAHRQEHGTFTHFQQLLEVPGIGPKKLSLIQKHTTL